jgi:glycosyltransferase involved in cell wall biosynthesis
MRIAIIADSFPPLKNSAAVLISSLAETMALEGHEVLVVTPSSEIDGKYLEENFGAFKVLRLRCGQIKSNRKLIRGLQELMLFFTLPHAFKRAQNKTYEPQVIIWYSPSIFFGRLVKALNTNNNKSYLILRDIVPQWLVDIGLISKGLSYRVLKWFEMYQYRQADFIGVQSPGNMCYVENLKLPKLKKLEVLPNWMPSTSSQFNSADLQASDANLECTILAGRKIFIYAGNLGEAQGVENLAQMIDELREDSSIGFLIIGRGSKKDWIQNFFNVRQLKNVLVLDEVSLETLNLYYRQVVAGLVFLNLNHQSHNIPGKFISYLEAKLPVVACVNRNNDLVSIMREAELGLVGDNPINLARQLALFLDSIPKDAGKKARDFYEANYRPLAIARQILTTVSTDQ